MTDVKPEPHVSSDPGATEWDVGGLHLTVSFRRADGATLRVFGPTAGGWTEMLRFDDFIDEPHHHVPAHAEPFMFDRAARGEPLDWFVAQVRDHLEELLTAAGFAEVLPRVDLPAVAADAEQIRKAMIDCVPDGYLRVPGIGLQRAGAARAT
jgi:hypothetical protein